MYCNLRAGKVSKSTNVMKDQGLTELQALLAEVQVRGGR